MGQTYEEASAYGLAKNMKVLTSYNSEVDKTAKEFGLGVYWHGDKTSYTKNGKSYETCQAYGRDAMLKKGSLTSKTYCDRSLDTICVE